MSGDAPNKCRPAGNKPPISASALVSLGLSLAAVAVVLLVPLLDSPTALTAAAVIVGSLSAAGLILGTVSYVGIVRAETLVVGKGFALWAMTIGGVIILFMAVVVVVNLRRAAVL